MGGRCRGDGLQIKAVRDDVEVVVWQDVAPFGCDKRRNGDDVKLRETIGDKACEEKGERDVTVVEKNGKVAVCGEKKGGTNAVRMDEGRVEVCDGLVEKREEAATVPQILAESPEACSPMFCGEWNMREGRCLGAGCKAVGRVVGGQEKQITIGGGKHGDERPEAFLRAAREGGAVQKKDVEFCGHALGAMIND